MKKILAIMVVAGLLGAIPAFAEHKKDAAVVEQKTMTMHTHTQQDADCARECDLLLKECAQQVDSIHERIQKIKSAIETNGAKPENLEELKLLNRKLKEANETLRALTKPGR